MDNANLSNGTSQVIVTAKIILGLILFFIGLRLFGGALKSLANPTLLAVVDNPWAMALICFGVTLAVQSSSITTALIVALTASNQLSLAGAIGGIIGANVGTTITAWIAAAVFGMETTARHAAIAHTFLNLTMAALALPFARQIASLVSRL